MEGLKLPSQTIKQENSQNKNEKPVYDCIEIENFEKDTPSFKTKNREAFFLSVPEFVKNKTAFDITEIESESKFQNTGYEIRGTDKDGNFFMFKTKDGVYDKEKASIVAAAYTKDGFKIFVPLNEKMRVSEIKRSLKDGVYWRAIMNGQIKKADVLKLIESANLSTPKNIEKIDENWGQQDPSVENTFETDYYDTDPKITLYKKDADVSYHYADEKFERTTDIYKDARGNSWYEITKTPEKQMAISLLAQSFFHISPIVEVKSKEDFIDKMTQKLNPKIKSAISKVKNYIKNDHDKFLSKGLNFENLPQKELDQMLGEYIAFCSTFELAYDDRNFAKRHNVRRSNDSYALFDFDGSGLETSSDFKKEKANDRFEYFMNEIKYALSKKDEYGYSEYEKEPLPLSTVKTLGLKLKEMLTFFQTKDGQDFFNSVLNKTNYIEKVVNPNDGFYPKKNMGNENNESLYQTFIQKIQTNTESLVDEINKQKEKYHPEEQDELEKIKQILQ